MVFGAALLYQYTLFLLQSILFTRNNLMDGVSNCSIILPVAVHLWWLPCPLASPNINITKKFSSWLQEFEQKSVAQWDGQAPKRCPFITRRNIDKMSEYIIYWDTEVCKFYSRILTTRKQTEANGHLSNVWWWGSEKSRITENVHPCLSVRGHPVMFWRMLLMFLINLSTCPYDTSTCSMRKIYLLCW